MWQIGVWEQGEGLAEEITAMARGYAALVRACSHPALLAGQWLDLLVVSPRASGWAGAGCLSCGTALLPGALASLSRALPARTMLSYGTSPRSTITLSGIHEGHGAVAIQREFTALDGHTVERQELVLDYDGKLTPELFLARAGVGLLLGRL